MKRFSVVLALILLSGVLAAQEGEAGYGQAEPRLALANELADKVAGVMRPEARRAITSCVAPDPLKGNLTLGVSVNAFLGDTHSCFQNNLWLDIWSFSAPAGQVSISFTSTRVDGSGARRFDRDVADRV